MAERDVIKEFLVRLGFQVSAPNFRQFFGTLALSEKMSLKTGKAVLGVAVAAEAMVTIFARNMEKMYYASQRTRSTVESLQAVGYGAGQVGVGVEAITAAIEEMSQKLRTQPGARALLDQIIGKPSEGMQDVEAFYELMKKLKDMPHPIGTQFAAQFGFDEKTFFMVKANLDQMIAADAKRRQMNRDAGIDAQAAAEAAREYMNELRSLWETIGLLVAKMSIDLLPTFRAINATIKDGIGFLTKLDYSGFDKLLDSVDKQATRWGAWGSAITIVTSGLRAFGEQFGAETTGKAWALLMGGPNWRNGGRPDGGLFPKGTPGYDAAARVLNGPTGGKPSEDLGKQMVALGMLKRHRDTTTDFPGDDLDALQAEIEATERRIANLRSQGYVPSGISAPGAVEAMRYGQGGGPVTIQQTNTFEVTSPDPVTAARRTMEGVGQSNAELVRNLRGAHR